MQHAPDQPDIHANIHCFDGQYTGLTSLDVDGDPLKGWYWELIDGKGHSVCGMRGPYFSRDEAEAACHNAAESGDFI